MLNSYLARVAGILILVFVASPAASDDLTGKRCVIIAAGKLPVVQGLVINGSNYEEIHADEAASDLSDSITNLAQASNIAEIYGLSSPELDRSLNIQYGDSYTATNLLRPMLKASIVRGFDVFIDFTAAGQAATVQFRCAVGSNGAIQVVPRGVVK